MLTASMTQREKAVPVSVCCRTWCVVLLTWKVFIRCVHHKNFPLAFVCPCHPGRELSEAVSGTAQFSLRAPVTSQPPQVLLEKLWNNPDLGRL